MRRDREYWSRQVEAWRSSGLSRAEYCRRHELVYATMNYWVAQLARDGEAAKQKLVEVKAAPSEPAGRGSERAAIELVVAGRYLLRLWPGVRSGQLREVLRVLEERG